MLGESWSGAEEESDVQVASDGGAVGVLVEEGGDFLLPGFVGLLVANGSPPSHLAPLVPFSVGGHDGEGLQRTGEFGDGHDVLAEPGVVTAPDLVPVPLLVRALPEAV